MLVIFQGETGGYLPFLISITNPAVTYYTAGYLDVVSQNRVTRRYEGLIVSGYLYIAKSGLSALEFGDYICLPQVKDDNNLIYFLDPQDVRIIEIPNY